MEKGGIFENQRKTVVFEVVGEKIWYLEGTLEVENVLTERSWM